MQLRFSFPRHDNTACHRDQYVLDPLFNVRLSAGTLFVFSPRDDLLFCHEAEFTEFDLLFYGSGAYRFAYVFRWIQESWVCAFHRAAAKRHAIRRPPEGFITREERQRKKQNARARATACARRHTLGV